VEESILAVENETSFDAQALVFDLDGVLVDTMPAIRAAWTEWALRQNLPPANVLSSMHMTGVELVRKFAPELDPHAEIEAIAARQRRLEVSIERYPGALELLDSLPIDRWAIVTSARRAGAIRHLTMAGLPEPRVLVSAEDTVRGKPDPTGFRLAAELLGVDPRDCFAIEDSPGGVRAALRARMFVAAVTTTHVAADLSHADAVIRSLDEINITPDGMGVTRRVRVAWREGGTPPAP
jgi:sugar-phosphatase